MLATLNHTPNSEMKRMLPRESRLMERAILGDGEAFAGLYDAYVDRIYRFVYMYVEDKQAAEDITSETFLKAWEKITQFEMRGLPLGVWLFRIARNAVMDYYRKHRTTMPLILHEAAAPDLVLNAAEEAETRLESQRVRAALHQLTEDQRQVLILKFTEGLSTEEVAQVMGRRVGAIRALQMRGLQALQKQLIL